MNNVKGKEISLVQTTVKIPGKRPRGSEMPKTNPQFSGKPTSLPNTGLYSVLISNVHQITITHSMIYL